MRKPFFGAFALTIVVCATYIPSAWAQGEVRLVLQITVDGLRADLPMRSMESFGDGGFRYLLDNGTVFANAYRLASN